MASTFLQKLKQRGAGAEASRDDGPSVEELLAEVDRLSPDTDADATSPEAAQEARRLRHLAGIRLIQDADGTPSFPTPNQAEISSDSGLAAVAPGDLSASAVRAGILESGCLLVRGIVDTDLANRLAEGIEAAFQDREAKVAGNEVDGSVYEEFNPEPGHVALDERPWIAMGGGVLAVDSPTVLSAVLGAFERSGLTGVISEYLGEPALFSAQKSTLRKADPSVAGAWHQDGHFLGDVRALNVWLSLSRCGDLAPGLDVVPKRFDDLVEAGTDGAPLSYVITDERVKAVAGDAGIIRPVFEPGDVLLFDDRFLHQTGSDPAMPNPRYAVESWFFGASGFPKDYAPLAA